MRKRRHFLPIFSSLGVVLAHSKWFCFSERCIRKVCVLSFVILTCIAGLLHVILAASVIVCLNWKTEFAVRDLCHSYDSGLISGNLCEDLCHAGQVAVMSCYLPHLAKDIVFTAKWKEHAVVIKSRHANMAAYDPFPYSALTRRNTQFVVNDFWQIVNDIVQVNYDIDFKKYYSVEPEVFLQTVLSSDFESTSLSRMERSDLAFFQSVWLLVQQKEYLTFKLFENSSLFPRVYGSCGHFYAVEQLTPLSDLLFVDWQFRVELATRVVRLLEAAEQCYPSPLRICDMKMSHFGIDQKHRIKILDGDDVYFQNVLNKIVCYSNECQSDHDCSFFDCKMKCNFSNHTCNTETANSNLQVVCEKMLTESNFWKQLFQPNLIHSLPREVARTLAPALSMCTAHTELFNRTESFFILKEVITKALSTNS